MRSMRRKKPEERAFSVSSASSSARNTLVQQQAVQDKAIDLIRSGDVEALLAMVTPPPPPEESPMSPPFEAQTPTLSEADSQSLKQSPAQTRSDLAHTLQLPHTKQGSLALGVAAEEGRVDCAEALLSLGVAVDLRDAQGMTALLLAAKYGAAEAMIALLIHHKADIHTTHPVTRENALFLASRHRHTHLVRLFLTQYAMSDSVDAHNAADETPLWNAVKEKQFPLAELLIAHSADVNVRQSATGTTPLIAAVFAGEAALDTLQFLLRKSADVSLCMHSGESALAVAARHGHVAIIEALCAHTQTLTHTEPLTDVQSTTDIDTALIDRRDSMGRTPLIAACLTQKESAVRALLSHRASVDVADKWRYTPLIFTARSLPPAQAQAQAEQSVSLTICELLLEARANVDATDNYGLSAFMHACAKSNWPVVKRLLTARANPQHTDREGRSALQLLRSEDERETAQRILQGETTST